MGDEDASPRAPTGDEDASLHAPTVDFGVYGDAAEREASPSWNLSRTVAAPGRLAVLWPPGKSKSRGAFLPYPRESWRIRAPSEFYNFETKGREMRCGWKPGEADEGVFTCSFLIYKARHIPYPQVDPGFSGEEAIRCLK